MNFIKYSVLFALIIIGQTAVAMQALHKKQIKIANDSVTKANEQLNPQPLGNNNNNNNDLGESIILGDPLVGVIYFKNNYLTDNSFQQRYTKDAPVWNQVFKEKVVNQDLTTINNDTKITYHLILMAVLDECHLTDEFELLKGRIDFSKYTNEELLAILPSVIENYKSYFKTRMALQQRGVTKDDSQQGYDKRYKELEKKLQELKETLINK